MRKVQPALTIRDNEFLGDMAAWVRAHSEDNREQVERLLRNLRAVRERELTPRQEEMVHLYYDLGLNTVEISERVGILPSTVSKTLQRARNRIRHCLQYSF